MAKPQSRENWRLKQDAKAPLTSGARRKPQSRHKRQAVKAARVVPCLKGYTTAQDALRRLKEHGCVYRCLVCEKWHTNHSKYPMWNESPRDHVAGYAMGHQKRRPQQLHHNLKGEVCVCNHR